MEVSDHFITGTRQWDDSIIWQARCGEVLYYQTKPLQHQTQISWPCTKQRHLYSLFRYRKFISSQNITLVHLLAMDHQFLMIYFRKYGDWTLLLASLAYIERVTEDRAYMKLTQWWVLKPEWVKLLWTTMKEALTKSGNYCFIVDASWMIIESQIGIGWSMYCMQKRGNRGIKKSSFNLLKL